LIAVRLPSWVAQLAIDSSKIAVLGGSAGGYLTLATGYRVKPRPAALVAFWGYGDLIGDWYSKPSPHPRHQRSKMTEEKVRKQVSGPAIANSKDRNGDGGAFYQFCKRSLRLGPAQRSEKVLSIHAGQERD